MSVGFRNCRAALNFALAGTALAFLGGCASDATRLSDPFSNPFQTATRSVDPAPTGAIPDDMPARSGGFHNAPIQSSTLPPPSAAPLSPAPVAMPHVASVPQHVAAAPGGGVSGNWSAQGGMPVTVRSGETAAILAGRYGVPADALLRVNGLSSPAQVQPGTKLTIPVYSATAAAAPAHVAPAHTPPAHVATAAPIAAMHGKPAAPAKMAQAQPKTVFVAGPAGKVAKVQTAATPAKLQPLKAKTVEVKQVAPAKTALAAPVPAAKLSKPEPAKVAKLEPAPAPKAQQAVAKANVDPQPTASLPPKAEPAAAPAADANPEFRWPARGRIIQGFKSGGNDGINISVPEGTAVKAAENGVVAYAGSELKGYGNLVLIRHPNGFVSAYANNGEIDVKRGDTVKRGQTIAKSGQSGNVATPQLHFELRKGSTPVDPTNYLAGL
jgi:murein DD-endopeptidase MepM/ murein hydrolase activator NlpD